MLLNRKTILICLLMIGFLTPPKKASSQVYRSFLIKAGYGIPYGAYGFHAEFRRKNVSGYMGGGYMRHLEFGQISVPSSYNLVLGFRHYIFKPEERMKPYAGIHAGWMNNYYNKEIGTSKYDPVVYGLGAVFGVQVNEGLLHMDLSLMFDPGFIMNPENHPYYKGKIIVTPAMGIGINLYDLGKLKRKRFRDNERAITDSIYKLDSLYTEMLPDMELEVLISDCEESADFPVVKYQKKNTLGDIYICRQLTDDTYILMRIPSGRLNKEKNYIREHADSTLNQGIVIIAVETQTKPADLSVLVNLFEKQTWAGESVYKATDGELIIWLRKDGGTSVRLSDLRVVCKKGSIRKEMYFDDVLICL